MGYCNICSAGEGEPCEMAEHAKDTVADVVAWLRAIPPEWREDWGLNATEEIAGWLESGRWMTTELPGGGT